MLKVASQNSKSSLGQSLRGLLGEARTQILLWYAGLFLLLGSLAIPAFRWILFRRVDARVRADLAEQVEAFQDVLASTSRDVPAAIEQFIAVTQPEDDNYFIFFLNDRFHTSSPQYYQPTYSQTRSYRNASHGRPRFLPANKTATTLKSKSLSTLPNPSSQLRARL